MEKEEVKIPLSQSDLEDLMAGEEFHWVFNGIKIHLLLEEQE